MAEIVAASISYYRGFTFLKDQAQEHCHEITVFWRGSAGEGVHGDMELVGNVPSGEQALALCSKAKPDAVLMDLVMPGMDGATATRKIKEQCCLCGQANVSSRSSPGTYPRIPHACRKLVLI